MLKAGRGFWAFVAVCVAAICVMLVHSFVTYQTVSRVIAPASARAMTTDTLSRVAAAFVAATDTAPPAAVDDPRFILADDAAEIVAPEDEVFLVDVPDGALVFPKKLMAEYEVVNLFVGGRMATVTYCANTDSAVGFWDSFGGLTTTFEPTQYFVYRNLVLRDRATGSAWPQLLGVATAGHLGGLRLQHLPVYRTTWDRILRTYPDAKVLAMDPNHPMPGHAPVRGADVPAVPYYVAQSFDDRLADNDLVIGVWLEDAAAALPVEAVNVRHMVSFQAGDARLVAVRDSKSGIIRVFDRRLGGSALMLDPVGGVIQDRATRSVWDDRGRCVSGALRGLALKPVDAVSCTWTAWVAFFPETEVYK